MLFASKDNKLFSKIGTFNKRMQVNDQRITETKLVTGLRHQVTRQGQEGQPLPHRRQRERVFGQVKKY